mgnify:CR=1 FL=1
MQAENNRCIRAHHQYLSMARYIIIADVRAKYGFQCKTNSDTETILRAYDKLGPRCLDDFDGMFAFVIYDRNKNENICSKGQSR